MVPVKLRSKLLTFFKFSCNNLNHLDGFIHLCRIGSANGYRTVIGNINLNAGLSDDSVNGLTLLSHNITDLFGIDLMTNDLVWMNLARDADTAVAGTTPMGFLIEKFHITGYLNLKILFTMLADEVVDDPEEAEVLLVPSACDVSSYSTGKEREIIREYDFERILALLEASTDKEKKEWHT